MFNEHSSRKKHRSVRSRHRRGVKTGEETWLHKPQDLCSPVSLLACLPPCLSVTQYDVFLKLSIHSPWSAESDQFLHFHFHLMCCGQSALTAVEWVGRWWWSRTNGTVEVLPSRDNGGGAGPQKVQICGWNIWKCEECVEKRGKKVGVFKTEQERQKSGKRINGSHCLNNSSN